MKPSNMTGEISTYFPEYFGLSNTRVNLFCNLLSVNSPWEPPEINHCHMDEMKLGLLVSANLYVNAVNVMTYGLVPKHLGHDPDV